MARIVAACTLLRTFHGKEHQVSDSIDSSLSPDMHYRTAEAVRETHLPSSPQQAAWS
jgi:hypothetical protein